MTRPMSLTRRRRPLCQWLLSLFWLVVDQTSLAFVMPSGRTNRQRHQRYRHDAIPNTYLDSLGGQNAILSPLPTTPLAPTNDRDHLDTNEGAHSTTTTASTIPMNTPARQSLPDHLELQAFAGKGLGVVTTTVISAGTTVGDYTGEILSVAQTDRLYTPSNAHLQTETDRAWTRSRMERGQTLTGTYLYGVATDPITHVTTLFVDAEDEYVSSWTRFLNHDRQPNLRPKSLPAGLSGQPRIWFVAERDILPGEELTYDYGDNYWCADDEVV